MRCLLTLAASVLPTYDGARVKRASGAKTVSGVPILNYEQAYGGARASAHQEENWSVVLDVSASNHDIQKMCGRLKSGCKLAGNPDKRGFAFFSFRGSERDLEAALAHGKAQYVEVDTVVSMIPVIQGEDQKAQGLKSWGLEKIGVNKRITDGTDAQIYVIDTGLRSSHTDFGGRAKPAMDMSSGSKVLCEGVKDCAKDANGHGTHCAGTAAGTTYGVAPGATIHGIKVLSDNGSGQWSWSLVALDYVAGLGHGIVASMSLGGPGQSAAMKQAVQATVDAGVVVVVAAGNDNDDACRYSPAFAPAAITVGSTDNKSNNRRSSYSNYGKCVDFWAPGRDITSAWYTSDSASNTISGTSMACPHVSGGAALIVGKAVQDEDTKTSAQVLRQLKADSYVNYIAFLKADDTNNMLYVGSDAPPPAMDPPTRAPSGCKNGNEFDGENCKCPFGQWCKAGGNWGCRCSTGTCYRAYAPDCEECSCR